MEYLIFIGIALAVLAVIFSGGLLLVKYPSLKKAFENSKLILSLINRINEIYDWKWSGELDLVCDYVLIAINIIEETQTEKDLVKLREIIFKKAIDICAMNGIEVEPSLLNILGKIVDQAILMKKEV